MHHDGRSNSNFKERKKTTCLFCIRLFFEFNKKKRMNFRILQMKWPYYNNEKVLFFFFIFKLKISNNLCRWEDCINTRPFHSSTSIQRNDRCSYFIHNDSRSLLIISRSFTFSEYGQNSVDISRVRLFIGPYHSFIKHKRCILSILLISFNKKKKIENDLLFFIGDI